MIPHRGPRRTFALAVVLIVLAGAGCAGESGGEPAGRKTGGADACRGTPEPERMCTQQYEPVCGCDGRTYGNACMAGAAGIRAFTRGPCGSLDDEGL